MTDKSNISNKSRSRFKLTLLHTNDIHGNLDKLPYFSTKANEIRHYDENVLLLDSGDIFLRGEYQYYVGKPESEIFSAMKYDAWVPGNNDFRVPINGGSAEQSNKQLANIIHDSYFTAVCANVTYRKTNEYLNGFKPYYIIEKNGIRIAVIGVTSLKPQERNWAEAEDKYFERGDIVVRRIISEIKEKCDIVIVLSHCGINVDLDIAEVNGVSAVLGADDHYRLERPICIKTKDNRTVPIIQGGGEDAYFLGRLDMLFELRNKEYKLVEYNGSFCDISSTVPDIEVLKIIDSYAMQRIVA